MLKIRDECGDTGTTENDKEYIVKIQHLMWTEMAYVFCINIA